MGQGARGEAKDIWRTVERDGAYDVKIKIISKRVGDTLRIQGVKDSRIRVKCSKITKN